MSRCLHYFLKTADNEKEHAKMWFMELAGIGDTKEKFSSSCMRIMSGQICMKILLKQLEEEGFQSLQQNSGQQVRLRSTTKKDIVHSLRTLNRNKVFEKSEVKVNVVTVTYCSRNKGSGSMSGM